MVVADVIQTGNVAGAGTCQITSAVMYNADTRLPSITDVNTQDCSHDMSAAESSSDAKMKCTQCYAEFSSRQELFQHVKMTHQQHANAARRTFRCDQCMRAFKSMTALRNHARTHSSYFDPNLTNMSGYSLETSFIRNSTAIAGDPSLNFDLTKISCPDSTFTIFDVSDVTPQSSVVIFSDSSEKEIDTTVTHSHATSDKTVAKMVENPAKMNVESEKKKILKRRRSGIPVRVNSLVNIDISSNAKKSPKENAVTVAKPKCSTPIDDKFEPVKAKPKSKKSPGTLKTSQIQTVSSSARTPKKTIMTRTKSCSVIQNTPVKAPSTPMNRQNTPVRHKMTSDFTPMKQTKALKTPLREKVLMKTPSSQKKTPGKQMTPKTPCSQKKTPCSQKRTPFSQKKTPLGQKTGLSTPKSKKEVLSSSKKTPRSCSKTPSGTQFKCSKCGKSFGDKARLEVHFAIHTRETPDKCGVPKSVIKKKPNPNEIAVESSKWQKFECPQCHRTYNKAHLLEAHIKTHTVNAPYRCDHCGKSFRYLSSLKAHSFIHIGEEKPSDDITSSSDLRRSARHTKVYIGDGEKRRVSNIFSILSDVFPLEKTEEDGDFACKTCDFKSKSPAELLSHLKCHSRVGPYTCTTCSKSYRQESNLKIHEKIHSIQRLKQMIVQKSSKTTIVKRN